ncbi:unnamed protein product [Notodromas monacha]|uniref:Deoxynucleoside kinase domain-containing protein n=1 Tax=Notodromas monacha TaxID=399045 RepID=A0A7R9GLI8_9CRUS|nr:unnamed protein product [Notodromas monacha]CAG0924991.1 unnamed protein product [Notodromas monacha]
MPPKVPMSRPMVVCVEGNIASGKTTFVNSFKKLADVHTFEEPVKEWRSVPGVSGSHNLLQLLYSDPKRWSFAFQHYVQLTMLKVHECPANAPIKVMERSIHSARHCFVENLFRSGNMTSAEYAVLDEWYKWIRENRNVNPDVIVYLRTCPETVHNRIKSRGRPEEQSISLNYLKSLHELHEAWIANSGCQVMTLDANLAVPEVEKRFLDAKD